jgi:Tol biopolymer transport system component
VCSSSLPGKAYTRMKRAAIGNRPKMLLGLLLAAGLLALVGAEEPAKATFPGQNGNIAFDSSRDGNSEIYSMSPFPFTAQTNLTNNAGDDYQPSFSGDGTKIAFLSHRDGNNEIYVMDANGSNQTRLTNNTVDDAQPSFSPDGTKIAFLSNRATGNYEIYVMDAKDEVNNETGDPTPDGNGDNPKRLTANAAFDGEPAFSPNGTKIAFMSNRDDNYNIYTMNATDSDNDGNGDNLKRLTKNLARDSEPSFAPNGKNIVFTSERNGNSEIYRMKAKPEGSKNRPRNLTNNVALDVDPVFSPDGTKIAFYTNRDAGNLEIYRMNADGTNLVDLTNTTAVGANDDQPDWGVFVP